MSSSSHAKALSSNYLVPAEMDLIAAIKLADKPSCFGVVDKGDSFQLRYAVRSRAADALRQFAADNKIPVLFKLGRWKLTGIHSTSGLHGVALPSAANCNP